MTKVGHKYYGKTAVELSGRRQWDSQKSTETWSDGGEVRQVIEALIPTIEEIVCRNASQSVSDYASDGEAALRVSDTGELSVGLRIHNHEAALIIDIPLKKLLIAALSEMRDRVGVDPDAQSAVSQLVEMGRQLSSLGGVGARSATTEGAAAGVRGSPPAAAQPKPSAPPPSPPGRKKASAKSNGSSRKPATLA